MDLGLAGKIVVVTGSGRGIGVEIALAFAREGANVAVHYNASKEGADDTVRRAKEMGVDAAAFQADVSKSDEVARFIGEVKERFGTVDVLVNNAATILGGPTVSFSDKKYRIVMGSELDGTFFCIREVLKIMLEKHAGKIINVSSTAAIGAFPETAAYSAAKAGIIGLTHSVAVEVAPMGIQVNAVAQGFIDSPFISDFVHSKAGQEFLDAKVPLGRFGKMTEVAASVLFLASCHADYFVGQVISPNGGLIIG